MMSPERDDDELRCALRASPAEADAASIEALQSRVMAHWRASHGAGSAQSNGGHALRWSASPRWWIGAGGLALGCALAVALWLQRPDPALEELMQPDVLSQMVAGEL
ncbi:hypothetical protein [Caldimonas sp. KR1-144]|uniref:hypothetical protein n=1 Tax=Caldimonas sp. KR1-144 TaxID=3400911 RepID=UPI003BFED1FB